MGGIVGAVLTLASINLHAFPAEAVSTLDPPYPFPEQEQYEYFYSTGHYVKGPFRDFYHSRGETRIFGYPQTEVFYDPYIGLWVQYFDNVRMEYHPENPEPYKVQLGLLADTLGHHDPPLPPDQVPRGNPFRRYFPETGHVVSFAFLAFYDRNGGLDIFGYPISEPIVENDRIVQYFQRARMEWHPERPRNERVVLGALGLAYIQRFGVPSEYMARQPDSIISTPTTLTREIAAIHAWAFVRNVITGREGYQTVYIYVTDTGGQPVSGATATVTVRYPSASPDVHKTGPTDNRGIASVTFPILSPPHGQKVVVDVTVSAGGKEKTAQTFFVPWY